MIRDLDPTELARRIVAHYRSIQRDLPWRRTRDPYAIWVSEIMLQQTRVATVIPYYERWMARFPTVRALAEAPLDDVLSVWAGLGYYSRARNLHRAAQQVVIEFGGELPRTANTLRALPGIGRYTAGAIASIAYQLREPLVDGNVARVLARIYALDRDVKSSAGQRALWDLADALVPQAAPGDFNQGLMELGATVCTPTRPACLVCPVSDLCQARAHGRERELPIVPARKRASQLPLIDATALWIQHRGELLLARRSPRGLYGGLWELPQAKHRHELDSILPVAVDLSSAEPVVEHNQTLTHRRLRIRVYVAEVRGRVGKSPGRDYNQVRGERYDQFAWHAPAALATRGLSAATQAIIDTFREKYGWNSTPRRSPSSKRVTRKSSPG